MDDREVDHGDVVPRQLLEARRHSPALLKPAHAALDHVPASVLLLVEASVPANAPDLIAALRNHRLDLAAVQPATNPPVAVTLVRCKGVRTTTRPPGSRVRDPHRVEAVLEALRLVRLPGCHDGGEWQASPVGYEVDLRPPAAPRSAECLVRRLLFAPLLPPPLAHRAARIDVPSTHHRSQSSSPASLSWAKSRCLT